MQSSRATVAVLVIGVGLTLAVAKWGDSEIAVLVVLATFAAAVFTSYEEAKRGPTAPPSTLPSAPEAARTYTPVIGGTAFGAVFIEIGRERLVLCLFPVANARTGDELARVKTPGPGLEAVIVFNDGPGENLFGERVIEALGVPRERVYALAPERKLTRRGGEDVGQRQAKRLPERLVLGDLTLERDGDVVRGEWGARYGLSRLTLGSEIPYDTLAAPPHAHYVVGNVAFSWKGNATGIDMHMSLRSLVLIEGSSTGSAPKVARFFATMGAHATVLGARDPDHVIATALAVTREGGDAFDQLARTAPAGLFIDVFTELAVLGEHDLADERLEALAEDERCDHALLFELGMNKLMREDLEAARAAFERAADAGSDTALNSWASTLGRLDELDEAIEVITRGLERMPDDPITNRTAFGLHLRAGNRSAAEAILDAGPFDDEEKADLATFLDNPPERSAERFTGYAEIALERGTARVDEGDLEGAEQMLRRAVTLDPLHLGAHAELAFVLGKREDDDALRTLCERAIEEVPGGQLLRFNLGNMAMRAQRWEEAREAFQALLDLLPTHRDARVNLVSALCALGREADAREHLVELEDAGLAPQMLAQLRTQCD